MDNPETRETSSRRQYKEKQNKNTTQKIKQMRNTNPTKSKE